MNTDSDGVGEMPAMNDSDIPPGYSYEPSESKFMAHIGRVYIKRVMRKDGVLEVWSAIRIQSHHVNTWNFAHGALIAGMAEIGTSVVGWDPDAAPCVAVDIATQFIGAPKLGDLLEVCGTLTKRTRSLVFTQARGEVAGTPVFMATSILKVIGA